MQGRKRDAFGVGNFGEIPDGFVREALDVQEYDDDDEKRRLQRHNAHRPPPEVAALPRAQRNEESNPVKGDGDFDHGEGDRVKGTEEEDVL